MTVGRLTNALIQCIRTNPSPFMTYADFGREYGFSHTYPPAWANKNVLDPVASALKGDPQIGIDLTFLIRSVTTGYPSVIDGQPYVRHDLAQEQRARDIADQIIAKFGLRVENPYRR